MSETLRDIKNNDAVFTAASAIAISTIGGIIGSVCGVTEALVHNAPVLSQALSSAAKFSAGAGGATAAAGGARLLLFAPVADKAKPCG